MVAFNLKISGINCGRVPGYPKEVIGVQDYNAVDKYECAYEDRIDLAWALTGYSGNTYNPHKYDPGSGAMNLLYALQTDIEPVLGIDKNSGNYTLAQITVKYGYVLVTDNEESFEPTTEYLTVAVSKKDSSGNSNAILFWDNAHTKGQNEVSANEAPKLIVKKFAWTFTKRYFFIPNWVFTKLSCVNNAVVRGPSINFAAETLLCSDPSVTRIITHSGKRWVVKPRLVYNPFGWNEFPRSTADGDLVWAPIYDNVGAVKKFYPLVSFSDIV